MEREIETNPGGGGSKPKRLGGRRRAITPARLAPLCLVPLLAAALLAPSPAGAATGDVIAPQHPPLHSPLDGWQAGTCESEPPQAAQFCSPATPDQFYERAAGHPNWGFTQFIVKHTTTEVGPVKLQTPQAELKTVRVDLPVGLSVNPQATPQCPLAEFEADSCDPDSQVGESAVTASLLGVPTPPTPPLSKVPVYNVVPAYGEPALFGMKLVGNEVFLRSDIAWHSDYHEGFTIAVPQVANLEPLIQGLILQNRLVFDGRAGDGTFLTTPSTCLGEATPGPSGSAYSTWLLAGSYAEAANPAYSFPASAEPAFEAPIPPGTSPKECETIPFGPTVSVSPGTAATESPAGARVGLALEHLTDPEGQGNSTIAAATMTLPAGMGLNPAAARGLDVCDDAELGKGTRAPVACPAASRIGTVEVETPALPPGSVSGPVFVGRQLSRDPLSGQQYRIFVDAESPRYGISARLIGNVRADPISGRLTTTISGAPQVPVSGFEIDLDDGPRAVLTSPPVCGPASLTSSIEPWSGNPPATPADSFRLSTAPGGGPCAEQMAARPFAPAFAVAPRSARAGAFSPLGLTIRRGDGEQELKGLELLLAPGFSARLRGVPYCPPAALAAAAASAGAEQAQSPSCPAASQIGSAATLAGSGPEPLRIEGKVFLSGPYKGAPLSLAVVTPATAGPFDLGTVVVRVALFVDPESARIRALSDPIPDVFGGAKLSIRAVDVAIDRERFSLNPTGCDPLRSEATLRGGGADPADPAAFSSFGAGSGFAAEDCRALGFRPTLTTKLLGPRRALRRAGHPKLRAVLSAREGDANIRRAALTLPRALFLDQSHIRTVCTRVQLAASACPPGSVYGHAAASSPLLDEPLSGPVYLVSSDNPLPDLLADLRGQVDVRLRGAISSDDGGIKTVFAAAPDVPVSRFALTMLGGRKGLLTPSRDVCAGRLSSRLRLVAHNGRRRAVKRLALRAPGCRDAAARRGLKQRDRG